MEKVKDYEKGKNDRKEGKNGRKSGGMFPDGHDFDPDRDAIGI
jgi:hypothetical protein